MAASAVCRRSRLVYGSWKTICTSRPRRRRSLADLTGRDRSCPQAVMVPRVGRSRPTIIRAMVVFPEPDSPTMASDRPGGRTNEMSSTATRAPNSLRSPATSRTGAPPLSGTRDLLELAAQLVRAGAAGQPAVEPGQGGDVGPADVAGVRAARRERALGRRRLEGGQRAPGDGAQPMRRLGDVRAGRGERG